MRRIAFGIIILGMAVGSLSSCGHKVPGRSVVDDKNRETLAEIKEKENQYTDSIKEIKTDNMRVNGNLVLTVPNNIATGNCICPTGFQKNYRKIFKHYISDYDEKNVFIDKSSYPTAEQYKEPKTGLNLAVGCTGFFSYVKKSFDPQSYFDESQNEFIKTYTKDELSSDDEYCLVSGKKLSISEAADLIQNFADDFVKISNYDNGLKVLRINLYRNDKGYYFEADLAQSMEGVDILDYNSVYGDTDENLITPAAFAYILSDSIDDFAVNSLFEPYKIKKDDSIKIENPLSAAEKVSEILAKKMKLELKRVSLEYCMIKKGNIQKKEKGKKTDREVASWATYCSYDLYDIRPCWVFYFDETEGKERYALYETETDQITFVNNAR